jgi:hypothetical protein
MKIQQQNAMIYCRADLNENASEIIHLLNQENEIQKCCKADARFLFHMYLFHV